MSDARLFEVINERIKVFFHLMAEGYRLRDKLIILEYHLRAPAHFLNHMSGKRNSRELLGDVYIKNRNGLFFCGRNFSSVFGASSYCESEVRREFKIKEGVAIDIGANLGMFSIPIAKMVGDRGQIISIEADKKNVELLKRNAELNNIKNIHIINKGAYSKNGKMVFYIEEFGTGGHSLIKKDTGKKEVITVETVDNIAKELKIKKVDIIKIDVEGVEIEVLKGTKKILKESHPKIIFEAVEEKKREEIERFLSEYGYKVRRIGDYNYVAEI